MKTIFKSSLLCILLLCISTLAHTQPGGHKIGVGAKPGEFYFGSPLILFNSINEIYGIIYSDNHGQDIQFKQEGLFSKVDGDRAEGVCYLSSWYTNPMYYLTSLDYAATCDTTKHYPLGYMFEGAEPGEFYNLLYDYTTSIGTLYRSIDTGNTYQVIADTLPKFKRYCSGYMPGQIYGITESLRLYRSSDYGNNFDSLQLDTIIPNAIQSIYGVNVYTGGCDGELYLLVFQNDNLFHIYHSTDHGNTFTHQSSINIDINLAIYLSFSAGRGPGEFYYTFENLVQPYSTIYTMLEIYYSSDAGVTFTKFVHNLYAEYVGIEANPGIKVGLKVWPNPASGYFTAQLPQLPAPNTSLSLTDLTSRQLRQWPLTQHATTLSCEGLPPGLYFVSLIQGGKNIATEKLIIN